MNQTPEELARKIEDAQAREEPRGPKRSPDLNTPAGQALRAAADLTAALFVGGFLGYWIDRWLGSKPWGMLILFFVGFAAGMLNIYRAQMGQDFKIGFKEEKKKDENGPQSS